MDFFLEEGFSQHLVYVPSLTVILEKGNKTTGCKTVWSRAKMYWGDIHIAENNFTVTEMSFIFTPQYSA